MDMWNLHAKAHAFGHMGSMKIKSVFIPKIAKKPQKTTKKVKKSKKHVRINNQGPFFGWFHSQGIDSGVWVKMGTLGLVWGSVGGQIWPKMCPRSITIWEIEKNEPNFEKKNLARGGQHYWQIPLVSLLPTALLSLDYFPPCRLLSPPQLWTVLFYYCKQQYPVEDFRDGISYRSPAICRNSVVNILLWYLLKCAEVGGFPKR